MVLPSLNSTLRVSSHTVTSMASGIRSSIAEVLIPGLHDYRAMVFHDSRDTSDFRAAESTTFFKSDRIEPEFRNIVISFHVHVNRFVTIPGVEEEPIWPAPENRRH